MHADTGSIPCNLAAREVRLSSELTNVYRSRTIKENVAVDDEPLY